ncbi:MAG TPA: HAMP domain-containing sensor histidine kinase [Puia sp.]|jgi:signal transduction histidine kinase|nr:HAMP domain-containing sensor histidine kinase [Puia sp.]
MKLFTQYSRVNIVASVLALLVGSLGYYFTMRYVLIDQLDDTIRVEEAEILNVIRTRGQLPPPSDYHDQQTSYEPATDPVKRRYLNTTRFVPHHRREPYRELIFSTTAGGQLYTVTIGVSEESTENLLAMIMTITAGMILLLLGTLFLANRLLLRRLWSPFYQTLGAMRRFNLSSRQPLPVRDTAIDEFRNLDEAARQMTGQILKDYDMLKGFTDNASHEMQTPLAIINSRLDLLIQDHELAITHHRPIQAMYDAIGRLRQLNQSLLLLTKIENHQFTRSDSIDMAPLIEEKLAQLEDPLRDRQLVVHKDLDRLRLPINGYLADILLNNLLLNAIRHNQDGGDVSIRLRESGLRIANSGPALSFDPATIFDRFVKGSHSGGTGLGLAIVRQICENYHFSLSYGYIDQHHTIDIQFPVQNFDKM